MKSAVSTSEAPPALGPYSQAVSAGDWLFLSGQVGLDPATGLLAAGGLAGQTGQALRNLGAVLKAAGLGLEDVVKTTVFMTDLAGFQEMNEVYGRHFGAGDAPFPARATVQVAALPKGAAVEIEAIAVSRRSQAPL